MVQGVILVADSDFLICMVVRLRGHKIQVRENSGQGQTCNYVYPFFSDIEIDIRAKLYTVREQKNQRI